MKRKSSKRDGRSHDITLSWLVTQYGTEWELWRSVSEEWLRAQDASLNNKLASLILFYDAYLTRFDNTYYDIASFFEDKYHNNDTLKTTILKNTSRKENSSLITVLNYISEFTEWVINAHLYETNDTGKKIALYDNPFKKLKRKQPQIETTKTPLPYSYICDLRKILCPNPTGGFRDWIWASMQTGQSNNVSGDWLEVDRTLIDENDNDCLWRSRNVSRKGKVITIYEVWSPVVAMVLFIKLHLPLRTYQIRMLDSGEFDYYRYQHGKWVVNTTHDAIKHRKHGVFKQFIDNFSGQQSTGLYINTNKTADMNKSDYERGYVIPWEHKEVLYWLEKLRNWQEKYNPISKPTPCTSLSNRHTVHVRSKDYLERMGNTAFLFRNPTPRNIEDKDKPVFDGNIHALWYKLLHQLEENLKQSGTRLTDGSTLELVHQYSDDHKAIKQNTHFTLHSLRVSLITSYIVDASVPLSIVSKLLAGHSRLLMTIYYTKLTPAKMSEQMSNANEVLESNTDDVSTFLKNEDLSTIKESLAYNYEDSLEVALSNRNPIGWVQKPHGICLAGNNTSPSIDSSSISGCWNGGEKINNTQAATLKNYSAVPHGIENCVRCRWFITEARYLPSLNSHLNFIGYKAHEAASIARKLEQEIDSLESIKYNLELENKPFTQQHDLQQLHSRYEKQIVESDEFTKDWLYTFRLIRKIIEIDDGKHGNKLVAVGSEEDVKIGFTETNSELLHLSLLCDDAEIYPNLRDEIKKTPIIQKRTKILTNMMMKAGSPPYLLTLDDDEQLLASNALYRHMANMVDADNRVDAFRHIADYIEKELYMDNNEILSESLRVSFGKENVKSISLKQV